MEYIIGKLPAFSPILTVVEPDEGDTIAIQGNNNQLAHLLKKFLT